jgi:hypothetical protein
MDMQETFEEPITEEGLWAVVTQRTSNKSGEEGIFHEFYVPYWETSNMTFSRCTYNAVHENGRPGSLHSEADRRELNALVTQ